MMRYLMLGVMCVGLISWSLLTVTGCNTDAATSSSSVKITATVSNLPSNAGRFVKPLLSFPVKARPERSLNLTPSVYRLALVNFWLTKDDGTDVNIINPDPNNLNFTETRPLILDFTTADSTKELLASSSVTAGTYTGYKMQFLYMEMKLPLAFHVPDSTWETDYAANSTGNLTDLLDKDEGLTRAVRLYFNATGKYWKKDFVVELDADSGKWWWMRRSVENNDSKNFFISVENNTHPPGGAGPDSIIDLFNDPEFWGSEDALNSSVDPIIVGTHTEAGGMNSSLEGTIVIPENSTEFLNLDLTVNVENTMNYGAGTAPGGVTFLDDVLDLGPGYDPDKNPENGADNYGDIGLHPFLPRFSLDLTKGATDAKPSAEKAYQLPQECIDGGWTEPEVCYLNYCTDNPTVEFCTLKAPE